MHHAFNDGWSMTNAIKLVKQTYTIGLLPPYARDFNIFVKFVIDSAFETVAEYWRQALLATLELSCPALPSRTYQAFDDNICTEIT